MEKEISIIIPTYNRKEVLAKCLSALKKQTYPQEKFEVIVIDGGNDGSDKIAKKFNRTYIKQKSKGIGQARNEGLNIAKGKYILFIGDDIIATPSLIEEHMKIHQKRKGVAVLGFIDWHPSIEKTDLIKFLAPNGSQFNYGTIKNKNKVSPDQFYTSNISLEAKWFKEDNFDTGFKDYGFEDTELGYRLCKKGLRIIFNPNAISYHLHDFNEKDFIQRQIKVGKNFQYFLKKTNNSFFKESVPDFNRIRNKTLKYNEIISYYRTLGFVKKLADEKNYVVITNLVYPLFYPSFRFIFSFTILRLRHLVLSSLHELLKVLKVK